MNTRVSGTPIDSVWLNGEVFTGVKPGMDGSQAILLTERFEPCSH